MTRLAIILSAPIFALLLFGGCETEPESRAPGDDLETHAAFIQGHFFGQRFHEELEEQDRMGVEIDRDVLLSGFRSGLRGDSLGYTPEEIDSIMVAFQSHMMEVAGAETRAQGEAFMAEFDQREDAVTTESGLRYRVIEEGEGATPDSTDMVTIHYEGRLTDGSIFDSSRQRGEPATFPVGGVVPGFSEALQLMQTGGRYEVVLPPELGYGDQAPPQIGPGQTLIFDVEMIEIDRRPAAEN